jgi:enamine deaminase RidA (YjgF/YER057c/UK114 family)
VIKPAGTATIYVHGQVGIDETNKVPTDAVKEVDKCLKHVEASVQAAGLGENAMEYVFKVRYHWEMRDGRFGVRVG